jgi:hypothetical protein
MNTVAVYHKSVPNHHNWEKVNLLKYFSLGVKTTQDSVTDVDDYHMRLTDVAVIQGWQTSSTRMRPHNQLRNLIIQEQRRMQRRVLAVDSSLFLYADMANPHHYLRYSFDDVFPGTGEYCDSDPDPSRWRSVSQHTGIALRDYRSQGNHVLICLQRNGGWSTGNTSVVDWLANTVSQLALYTDRPLVIRPHPGDKRVSEYINPDDPVPTVNISNRVTVSTCVDLRDDLKNCWAVVNHNSSPAVAAAVEGYPVFVTDPARSQCSDIANTDLANIENPNMPNRLLWAQRLAMSHWNFQELESGQCWRHMRQFIHQQ